ncbi:MAG TPA: enoyl-CoA hydratase-related protein, partial [Candidatus Dormibacteraeota bacterium]|nr:enoyl-CoA hydratase-related protein [Candidatus Dormibacteraeota bacterium]
EVLLKMEHTPKLFIAAIGGHCLGGGLEIALATDFRFAAEGEYRLGVPEVTLGLLPGNGGTQRLPRLIGRQKAMELLLTGKPLDPKAAVGLGIVDRLLPADRLLPEAVAFAATMAGGPTVAIGEIKLAAKQGLEMPLESALALERGGIFRLFETADAKEGLNAFAEKRKPTWKGE